MGDRRRPHRTSGGLGTFVVGVLLVFAPGMGFAQSTATILGSVADESGAVLPGTTLTTRNVATGLERTTISGGDGSYRLPALPVGSYELRAELQGFRTGLRSGLTLTVAQEAVVNFTLQVGDVTETVTVEGAAPLVNTTNAALGGLVDAARIESLPLLGRNYIDLTLMQTGVSEHQNINRGTARVGIWFSAKGATLRSNNYLLDGAMMQTLHGSGSASYSNNTLGLDGIQEYRVLTSSFGAEYGMRMGSQTIMVSKSGTNNVQGSAFEYYRNNALNARNFFDGDEKPDYTRHNYGGSLGGPIARDRTFFFGVVEVVRERLGETHISRTIPGSVRADGGLVPAINPMIKPFLDLYPLPNLPNDEYAFEFTQPTDEYFVQARVDHAVSNDNTLFGRVTFNDSERTEAQNFPDFQALGASQALYATMSHTSVLSPNMLNVARGSFSRTQVGVDPIENYIGPQYSLVPGKMIGTISPAPGISSLSNANGGEILYKQNVLTLSNDVHHTRGRHSLKYGFLFNQIDPFIRVRVASFGSMAFASLPDFLLGRPLNYAGATPGSNFDRHYRYRTFGLYLQDDMRMTSTLTLNVGLRYEFSTVPWEQDGLNAQLRFDKDTRTFTEPVIGAFVQQSSLGNWSPRAGFAWDVGGAGKTAIRGGAGLLYDVGWFNSTLAQGATAQPPFSSNSRVLNPASFTLPLHFPPESLGRTIRTGDYNSEQPRLLEYNLTVDRELPWTMGLSVAYAGSRGFDLPFITEGNPRVPEILADGRKFWPANAPRVNPAWDTIEVMTTGARSWYNSLQVAVVKRLTNGLEFQSSYTLAEHIVDENQAQLGADTSNTAGNFSPDPWDPNHNRGPASWDIRHNWKFNAIYRLPETALSGPRGALLNGWSLSTIVSLQSGYPFTPVINLNRSRSGVGGAGTNNDRPDLVPGVDPKDVTKGVSRGCLGVPAGTPVGTPERWFDPCAFTIPQLGFLGTAGRNVLRQPGLANVNLSIVKENRLGGTRRIQLRVEVFNLFNRVNFAPPSRTVFTGRADVEVPVPTAGRITATQTPARQIQLSSRVAF